MPEYMSPVASELCYMSVNLQASNTAKNSWPSGSYWVDCLKIQLNIVFKVPHNTVLFGPLITESAVSV